MNYKEAELPQEVVEKKATDAEVTVLHLEEDKNGEVKQVVDMGAEQKANVDTLTTTEGAKVQNVEVETESFSVFTITWKYGDRINDKFIINVRYVDTNGQEIHANNLPDAIQLQNGTSIDLEQYWRTIPGYEQDKIRVNDIKGSAIDGLQAITKEEVFWKEYYIRYKLEGAPQYETSNWLQANSLGIPNNRTEGTIYFVYKQDSSSIQIIDNLIDDGSLVAHINKNDHIPQDVTYQWLRADDRDGSYTEVKKVNFKDGASNLSEDGTKLYPSYDEGARKWYKVKVVNSDGTDLQPSVESEPFQVSYYKELQNGGFEVPRTAGNSIQKSNAEYKNAGGVWQTTGANGGRDIEIINTGYKMISNYNWHGEEKDAEDKENTFQFVELNCEASGALYQDVLTVKGQTLNYWLSHRARGESNKETSEYDTMYLVIMPTKETIDLVTQNDLINKIDPLLRGNDKSPHGTKYDSVAWEELYDKDGIYIARITSDDKNWHKVLEEGIGKYTPTASLTRFFFMAGNTASEDSTVGNFIDGVGFSQELPPVEEGKFNFTIKKNFTGLGNEQLGAMRAQLQFKISAKKNQTPLPGEEIKNLLGIGNESGFTTNEENITMDASAMTDDPSGNLSKSFVNRPIENTGSVYTFTVEEVNRELDGYTVTTQSRVTVKQDQVENDTSDPKEDFTATVSEIKGKTDATVEFTNNYRGDNFKNVNFTKVWDDGANKFQTRPESLDVTLKATVSYVEGESTVTKELTGEDLGVTATVTLTSENNWKTSWKVPVYYETDEKAKVLIHYSVEEGTVGGDYVYTSGSLTKGDGSEYDPSIFDDSLVNGEGKAETKAVASKKVMKAASVLNVANLSNNDIGEPSHNKYVTYNEATDDYTLNLDVTGKKGEREGVDVLFVVDTSGSMSSNGWYDEGLLAKVKRILANNNNNAVDQILGGEGNVNSAAIVSFAGKDETRTSSWYENNAKEQMKSRIRNMRATGGTNWTYAMMKADDMLRARADSKNEKVIIFLSDGEPTFSINRKGEEYGYGNRTIEKYYTEAIDVVNNSTALKNAKMYSVYLTDDTEMGMQKFANQTGAECINGITLDTALEGILKKIIPTYENVTVEDNLSEYVVFSQGTPTVIVTKKTASGTTVLEEEKHYVLDTLKEKRVKVTFFGELDDAATYTISFRIRPSEKAEREFAGEYPEGMTGDSGTGATSENKPGYYSNGDATLTYSIKGTDKKEVIASYPKPVIQVNTHSLTFEKVWLEPEKSHPDTIDLEVTYTDGTSGNIKLSGNDSWKETITNVPVTRKIQSIREKLPEEYKDDYTPSYVISEDGTSATVSNSYSKITTKNIKVVKEWRGNGPETDVKVNLYYTDKNASKPTLHETVTLNSEKKWTHTWENLEVTEGRIYAVREESIPANYTSNITYSTSTNGDTTTATITNVYDPYCADESYYIANKLQTMPLTITKTWDDDGDSQNKRPKTLGVTVTEGSHMLQFTMSGEHNVWTENATVLKRNDKKYSAIENIEGVADYENTDYTVSTVGNRINISFTNKIKTQSIKVTKKWIDPFENDKDKNVKRPGSIRFKLYKDGVEYRTYSLTADDKDERGNSWSKVIENLPAGSYRVEEYVEDDDSKYDYISTVTDDGNGHFTLTNKINWHIVKTTHAIDGVEAKPLEGAEFQLKQEDTVIATGISDKQGLINWAVSTGVDLTELNGTYTLVETKAPAGYMVNASGWEVTFDDNGLLTGGKNLADQKVLTVNTTKENGIRLTVENLKLYELPETGGTGIFVYTIGGTLLLMAAALLIYKMKREEVLKG